MKTTRFRLLILLFLFPVFLYAQEPATSEKVNWVTFEQAVELSKKEPRKIFVDLYTKWCGWCKRMDATTFTDPVIVDYLNQHFYAIKFDAETRDTITFKGTQFVFKPEYRVNEFALSLTNGKIDGYPTTIYLDEDFSMLSAISSYLKPEQLEPIVKYFGENAHKNSTWEEFQRNFKGQVKP